MPPKGADEEHGEAVTDEARRGRLEKRIQKRTPDLLSNVRFLREADSYC